MQLTKTDFIQYLSCPKSLWLLKVAPDEYPRGEFSTFLQKLTREGYEVERYVRQFFDDHETRSVDFQATFETADGLYARADAMENADGVITLHEVKSSTSVKTEAKHNHIKDACFQTISAQRSGQRIDAISLVHLNGDYVRDGEIDPDALLVFEDVTALVREIEAETAAEIDAALALLQQAEIDRAACSCLDKSRSQHCDTFALFNPAVPKPSIYSLPRLHATKRAALVADAIFDLTEIPDDFSLSAIQRTVVESMKSGAPIINREGIADFLSELSFPLYFLDYETFASAVPLIDGTTPHGQFPVQYSLHVLDAAGELQHYEYLEREACLPDRLLERLRAEIGEQGSVVSWHASFEKARNAEMGDMFPDHAEFLADVNARMVDLEDVFKRDYVDARFDGSTSIKKVLPVLCPELSYDDLDVQDGAGAMDAWQRMINAEPGESETIASNLLRYCALDTLAMVEIYRFLVRQTDGG